MRALYPVIEPHSSGLHPRDEPHQIYLEESGNPDGIPVVLLHGGPGSGSKPYHRQFFNPKHYRIVIFDQRGAGRSTPHGELANNDSHELIADMEWIRAHLGIDRWLVMGGSWGAALALLYAQTHPARVLGMILRGTFLARPRDFEWFLGDGVRRIYPDAWADLVAAVGTENNIAESVDEVLKTGGRERKLAVAKAWSVWTGRVVMFSLDTSNSNGGGLSATEKMINDVSIETHYACRDYFLDPNQLLRDLHRVPAVPTTIIHGRRDLTCTLESAWEVHQGLPGSELVILPQGGHLASETPMVDALVTATDAMAKKLGA